jgi:hypothetical protein
MKQSKKTLTNSSNFRRIISCNKSICRQNKRGVDHRCHVLHSIRNCIVVLHSITDLHSNSNSNTRMTYCFLAQNSNSFRRRFLVRFIPFIFRICGIKDIGYIIGIIIPQLLCQFLLLQLLFTRSVVAFGSLDTYLLHLLNRQFLLCLRNE